MVGSATLLRMAVVTKTALFLQCAASRAQAQESNDELSCAFATTFQVKNLIGRRTSKGNSLVSAVQTEINRMAELCEQEESDVKTITQLTKDVPDLAKKIKDTEQELKLAERSLSEFESSNKDVTDSACSTANGLAGNVAQMRNAFGKLFKKGEEDQEQNKAIEKAKQMNKRCATKNSHKATVERLKKLVPKLEDQKSKSETDLASLEKGLPDRSQAIKAAKAKTFAEIKAVFSGNVEVVSEGRKHNSPNKGSRSRKRRHSKA